MTKEKFINTRVYPERYRFFDDEFSNLNKKRISNPSVRKRLQSDARLAKILFDYKKTYNKHLYKGDAFFNASLDDIEFFDLPAYINISLSASKALIGLRKQGRETNRFDDTDIIIFYLNKSSEFIRNRILGLRQYKGINQSWHPYINLLLNCSNIDVLRNIELEEYKKSEAKFVRAANNNRQEIEKFLKRGFLVRDNVFYCRFDIRILCKFDYSLNQAVSLEDYRKDISRFFENLQYFDSVFEVLFPTAVLKGVLQPSKSPVGQILLMATEKVLANIKQLKAFASQTMRSGCLELVPASSPAKEIVPCLDGVRQFTQTTSEAINSLADFLTLERRYFAPRQFVSDRFGSIHCMREIKLNP